MKPKIVITTSSLLTDRMLVHNEFLKVLSQKADVYLWAQSCGSEAMNAISKMPNVHVQTFPKVHSMKYRWQMLRRINDFAWDAVGQSPARQYFYEMKVEEGLDDRANGKLKKIGTAVKRLGMRHLVEAWSEKIYLRDHRSSEAVKRLQEINPDLVVIMSPFRWEEPGIAAEAMSHGYRTFAFMTTWDNPSTKNRFMFTYDGYFCWTPAMVEELKLFYPKQTKGKPLHIIGAPQFDVMFNPRLRVTREEFAARYGFDPNLPIVTYALGSPNLFDELPGAIEFIEAVNKGALNRPVQVIVRAHPVFNSDPGIMELHQPDKGIIVQNSLPGSGAKFQTQDEGKISEWVNTFLHSDVVVNLASTVTVDCCLLETPVVNMTYDPSGKKEKVVKALNYEMLHFKPITSSGGIILADNMQEIIDGVNTYLADPTLHAEGRKWVAEYVAGFTDGHNGKRFAEAILAEVKA